jgi:ubiquitin-activating enzyme E1
LNKFYASRDEYINTTLKQNKQNPSIARAKLETLKKMYIANEEKSYAKCVDLSVNIFYDVFHNQIAQLLHAFPEDHVIEETGKPFWGGLKRVPSVIPMDLNDPLQVEVIQAGANIFAVIFNIPMEDNKNVVIDLAKNVAPMKFTPKKVKIEVDEKNAKKDEPVVIDEKDEIELKKLVEELTNLPLNPDHAPSVVEFEKDDPTNFHIEFMGGVSNLRARNYKIDEVDNFKVKLIAGKIIPAIATTTAMVVGVVGMEVIKFLLNKPAEVYKNVTINLALPLWVFNDPLPPIEIVDK